MPRPPLLRTALPAFLVACVAFAGDARAQGETGFLRGPGKTDIALSYVSETYDEFWVGSMRVEDPGVGEVTRESLSLWAAHGLAEDLDVVITASFVEAENDGTMPFDDERDLQDGSLGLKWRFHQSRLGPGAFSVLAAPSVKVPLSRYEDNAVTAIGDGQVDYRLRGILHYQLDCGVFASAEVGYDFRTEGTPDEVPIHLTAGVTLFDVLTVSPFYSVIDSRGNDDIMQVPFPEVAEDITRWGIGAYGRLTDSIGVTAGWKETIDGENTGDLTGWWLGLVYRF